MKIRVLSDLHLEFGDFAPPAVEAEVVVLAGDINVKSRGVAWAAARFPNSQVVYVPGNHEYYGGELTRTLSKMKAAAQGTNVHVLDRESVVIGGVRFLGATLWTDYRLTGNQPLAEWDAAQTLYDFKAIRDEKFSKVRPPRILTEHVKSRRFLEDALGESFDGPTVVVSHHGPTELSIHERYKSRTDHLNSAYASRLDGLMGLAKFWFHGHVHDSFDYDVYGTRVVCNPRGYSNARVHDEMNPDINPDFDPALILEL